MWWLTATLILFIHPHTVPCNNRFVLLKPQSTNFAAPEGNVFLWKVSVNLSRSKARRSIDLWPLEPSVVMQAPLRTTPCCALCARAVLDSVHWFFSSRFSLLWLLFFWLIHVLFLGRWLTMFVSPCSRNDALSSVFIPVPPFTSSWLFLGPPFTSSWSFLVPLFTSSWSFLVPPLLLSCCSLLNTKRIVPKPSTSISSGW